ncbi:MAG: GlsB/YeaQ/YmgE family stress response membrane protein [Pyrinomonadaceae bacterium]|nr:GlsB/YeaQ/YmgE family stress response membrane protein [Pyrinomonadaceae bacterium]MCX7639497.1 GlsB/YeaQ/YmgE family stress response membrane protein [Pyrinomonadaceae bacterium]MDW8304452.1 GlsB/YeaQ/YmgE family stress response membrane protein [Acidobacteriota bacterium]
MSNVSHIVGQLIVGLIIGVIARLLVPGSEPIESGPVGWLITALIGVLGAFVGSIIGRAIWKDENYKAGWVLSVIGAVILLLIYRWLF